MMGWHFTAADRRLGYGDDRIVEPGQTLSVDVDPVLCKSGLHASARIMDALRYAPGPYLWRVRLGGTVVRGKAAHDDKAAATGRTALWGFEATGTLRLFARRCALDVAHLWDPPDVVLRYLRTGDEPIRAAASDAASAAARAAARDAAWDAAWAARAAARDAAWDAAWDAARGAAWAAAWAAARGAAGDAAWAAARGAAGDAAGDAVRDRQNRRLTSMVIAEARRQGVYR